MSPKNFKEFLAQKTSQHVLENVGAFFIDRDIIHDKDILLKKVIDFVASASEADIRAQIVEVSTSDGECVVTVNVVGTNYQFRLAGDDILITSSEGGRLHDFRGDTETLIDIILGVKTK